MIGGQLKTFGLTQLFVMPSLIMCLVLRNEAPRPKTGPLRPCHAIPYLSNPRFYRSPIPRCHCSNPEERQPEQTHEVGASGFLRLVRPRSILSATPLSNPNSLPFTKFLVHVSNMRFGSLGLHSRHPARVHQLPLHFRFIVAFLRRTTVIVQRNADGAPVVPVILAYDRRGGQLP